MRTLSAADAIGPALTRTKAMFFRPFRLRTFLKLSLVAVMTECSGGSFELNVPGGHSSGQTQAFSSPTTFTPALIVGIVAALLATIVIGVFLFYLITRLRFAYFHCLIHNTREIRPGWRLYRVQAKRYFWLSIVVGLCVLVVSALIVLPFVLFMIKLAHRTSAGAQVTAVSFLSVLLTFLPLLLAVMLLWIAADLILRDLMMPHMALDDASAREAWNAVWAHITAEKKGFLLYAVLRIVLPLVAMAGLVVLMLFVLIFLGLVFGLIIYGIHLGIAGASGAAAVWGLVAEVLTGTVGVGLLMATGVCLAGPVFTAVREYALMFYGGRYARLGEILFPPQDATVAAEGAGAV